MTWKRRWCARRLLAAAPRILLPAVGFYLIALGAAPYVRAEVNARMIEVGANLLDVEGTMPELAGERVLVFNGARVVMLSGSSRLSVAAVLEHFQGYCTPAASEGFSRFLRGGDDRRGYVACLDRLAAASSGELLRVLGDVALDGLAAAGSVRYFYAGAPRRHHPVHRRDPGGWARREAVVSRRWGRSGRRPARHRAARLIPAASCPRTRRGSPIRSRCTWRRECSRVSSCANTAGSSQPTAGGFSRGPETSGPKPGRLGTLRREGRPARRARFCPRTDRHVAGRGRRTMRGGTR